MKTENILNGLVWYFHHSSCLHTALRELYHCWNFSQACFHPNRHLCCPTVRIILVETLLSPFSTEKRTTSLGVDSVSYTELHLHCIERHWQWRVARACGRFSLGKTNHSWLPLNLRAIHGTIILSCLFLVIIILLKLFVPMSFCKVISTNSFDGLTFKLIPRATNLRSKVSWTTRRWSSWTNRSVTKHSSQNSSLSCSAIIFRQETD